MGGLMSSIVVSGDTSGAITIAAPAVSGTNTLTLPANTGTVLTTASTAVVTQAMLGTGVAGTGPAFRAYLGSNQTLSSATFTKLSLNTETFDTNSNFDSTTNYRFTPTVAGYYQINANVYASAGTNTTQVYSALYFNGSAVSKSGGTLASGNYNDIFAPVSDIIYFNGSTDYLELWGRIAGSGTLSIISGSNQTWMSGALIRAA
jgi:hypothetical protein